MATLTFPNTFVAYTKIKSAEVNANFAAVSTLINTTGLNNDNIASGANIARSKLASGTASHVLINDGSGVMSSEASLAITRGGTGAATATAGFDALAPTTTRGDIIYRNATVNARLAVGAANTVLKTDGTDPAWGAIVNANIDAAAAIARSKVAVGTADHVLINDGTGALSSEASLAITRGGTGAATANAGFNALAPTTTKGDLIAFSTVNARLPVGSNDQVLTADSSQTLGVKWATPTSALTQPYELSNLGLACSVGSSALTIALKQSDGSTDPGAGTAAVKIGFRSSTATSGAYSSVTATAATSIVVSSGSTLGHVSAIPTDIWVYAINNSGTVELAVSSKRFDDGTIVSTTAEGGSGGADSATVMYSTTSRSNVPCRLIARLSSTQATAGTWATVPTEVSLAFNIRSNNKPTIQRFTSGSGTYTPTLGTTHIKVRMVGGGGGGGGSGSASNGDGTDGGSTTFGTSLLTCTGGGKGTGSAGPTAAGTATVNSPAITIVALSGGSGSGGHLTGSNYGTGEVGGVSPFGGAGNGSTSGGGAAVANTGSGGAGGGVPNSAGVATGTSGSAGGYLEAYIMNLATSYSYAVGAGGNGGSAGTNGNTGGAGGSGVIIVEEFYN